jgi:hypothetical protein
MGCCAYVVPYTTAHLIVFFKNFGQQNLRFWGQMRNAPNQFAHELIREHIKSATEQEFIIQLNIKDRGAETYTHKSVMYVNLDRKFGANNFFIFALNTFLTKGPDH